MAQFGKSRVVSYFLCDYTTEKRYSAHIVWPLLVDIHFQKVLWGRVRQLLNNPDIIDTAVYHVGKSLRVM